MLATLERALRAHGFAPAPSYACMCQETGWLQVLDGQSYRTVGPRDAGGRQLPGFAFVAGEHGTSAVMPCPRCKPPTNTVTRTPERQRVDLE